ncbi:hypothetical protein QA646_18475 [Rhizobium sp. CB3090]|uniref:hypothetical protein n=1 Tax=Rhizobium sp. CB3090 TaxID=3039156 RepID=UPI0024B1CF57|nr:hypothetical protein [Rhizobium sp. CB3090]WFU09227.1 hypothetical protein QA646_18475 [Rhizobium sp. CB3090]
MFPLAMKIVPRAVKFNPILAQDNPCQHFPVEGSGADAAMTSAAPPPPSSLGAYQYPPPIPPPDILPPAGEECVIPPLPLAELPCPVVEQAETLMPTRVKNAADKMAFINM